MNEILLIVIMYTSRAASHGHEIVHERLESIDECNERGVKYKKLESRNSFVCIELSEGR